LAGAFWGGQQEESLSENFTQKDINDNIVRAMILRRRWRNFRVSNLVSEQKQKLNKISHFDE